MIESPFILLILNCKKYNHKRLHQKKDWLDSCLPDEFRYFHIQGDPSLNTLYVIDFSDNLITVQCDDGYMALSKKMAIAYKCINETHNYNYVLKTDDDMKLIKKDFFLTIQKYLQKKNIDYGGKTAVLSKPYRTWQHCTNTNQKSILLEKTTYCSGHFYFIKKNIIETVLARYFNEICKRTFAEDHSFGYFISKITTNIKGLTIDIDKDIFHPYPIDGLFTGYYISKKKISLITEYNLLDHIPQNKKNPYLYACQHANKDISENVCIFENDYLQYLREGHSHFGEAYDKIKNCNVWDIICVSKSHDILVNPIETHPIMRQWGFTRAANNNNMPKNIIINHRYINFFQDISKTFYDSKRKSLLPQAWKLIEEQLNVYYFFYV